MTVASASVLPMGNARFLTAIAVVCTLAAHFVAADADASPMEDPALGGAVFTGPTHAHASSFFVNPAALGMTGRGWHLHIGGTARLQSLSVDRSMVNNSNNLEPGPSVSDNTLSPGGLLAYYSSFQDGKARFGVALHTPTWQSFPGDQPALGYHSGGGQLVQTMLTLAASIQPTRRLLLGIGFSIGYSNLRLKFSRDSALQGGSDADTGTASDCDGSACGFENPQAREEYDIQVGNQASLGDLVDLKNFSASFGIAYNLSERSWIALSYTVLPGAFETLTLSGDASITRAPRDGGETVSTNAEIGFGMAQMAFLGYRRPIFGSIDLVTDLRWQDWSRHNQFDIRLFNKDGSSDTPEWIPRHRGMKDVWRVSAGLESSDTEAFRYGARLRFETAAISQDRNTPTIMGGNNLTLATGTELRLSNRWIFSLGYEISLFPTALVSESVFDPREQVACVDSEFEFDECGAARNGQAFSTAAGNYSLIQHGLLMSFRYDSL